MTDDELQVLSDLYFAGSAGCVGAVRDEYIPEAYRLQERGWLQHDFHGDDMVWSLTATALGALELAGLHRGTDLPDQN